jgi:hypothetical protein
MTKDELVFCINCIKSVYPGMWSDTPEKVQHLLMDVYEEDVDLADVKQMFDERIIEEDEYDIMYRTHGYC